jgi:GMP reductase
MRIEDDIKLDYKDVLLRPKRSSLKSRKDVNLKRDFVMHRWKAPQFPDGDGNSYPNYLSGVPIIAANMDGVGTLEVADALVDQRMYTFLKKDYTSDELGKYFTVDDNPMSYTGRELAVGERSGWVAMSIGFRDSDFLKVLSVQEKSNEGLRILNVDIANGYTEAFGDYIKKIREAFPRMIIIAGNVCTADQTQELILKGADIVKVGIGPGSVCTTRLKTGVGYPQLSAVIECADAAHGVGGFVIADGGCTCPGDLAKAFGAGADFVMLGGMLAGHDEGGGEIVTKYYSTGEQWYDKKNETYHPVIENKQFVQFYGMSSTIANDKHAGGLKKYRASEGRDVLVPYRGKINNTLDDILGGLRSTMTYIGAMHVKNIGRCATFIRCNDTHNRVFES